jgi:hypothetical protein
MIISQQFLLLPFLFITTFEIHNSICANSDTFNKHIENQNVSSINKAKHKTMGISINLYRLEKAEKLEDIKDLENQLDKV